MRVGMSSSSSEKSDEGEKRAISICFCDFVACAKAKQYLAELSLEHETSIDAKPNVTSWLLKGEK